MLQNGPRKVGEKSGFLALSLEVAKMSWLLDILVGNRGHLPLKPLPYGDYHGDGPCQLL